jgi:NAD(P)-dependent dehydrogenase (short-subunit alcohol dehydrogenase family)
MFWRLASGLGVALTVRAALREWRRLRLRDKVVLITGGSRGLGFLLAREFAHQGSRIAICARDPGELRRAVADLAQTEVEVLAVPCDISCQDQVERMVERVRQRFGRIDVLVNNAGVIQVGPMESMTPADYEECLRVMLWGMIYPTMAVLPLMRGQGAGRIVNITSIGGKVSVPHLLPYGCAKFAAVGFSEGLHAELARQGIRVVTVVPGLMRTGSFLNASFKGQEENEYVWFSLGATLPGISMDAERPARQIVRAAEFGDAEVTLSLPARVLARFQGLFPGLTADLLGLVNRLLPGAESADTGSTRGAQIHARLDSTAFRMATQMGQSAAERFHELPGLAPRLEPRLAETPGRRPEEKEKEPAA